MGPLPAVRPGNSQGLGVMPGGPQILPNTPRPVGMEAGVTVDPGGRPPAEAFRGEPTPADEGVPQAVPTGDAVVVGAAYVQGWAEGRTRVRILRPAKVRHRGREWECRNAVCWETPEPGGYRFDFFFDGGSVERTPAGEDRTGGPRSVTLRSSAPLALLGVRDRLEQSAADTPLVRRAAEARATNTVVPVQYEQPLLPPIPDAGPPGVDRGFAIAPPLEPGGLPLPFSMADRVSVAPRNFGVDPVIESRPVPGTTPPEQVITVTRGVNVVIERPSTGEVLDLTADSVVIWTDALAGPVGDMRLGQDTPFQVYLQGNIVLRQGTTVARAQEAFFDRREGRGLLLNSEVRSFVPALRGDLRVRAESVRFQTLGPLTAAGPDSIEIQATNGWVTASRFGKPTYRLQAATIAIDQRPTGTVFDPATGLQRTVTEPWLTSTGNQFLLGDVPVVSVPYLTAPAEDFSVPIKRVSFDADDIFGVQVRTQWDVGDLFGLSLPPRSEWTVDLDYLSERGPRTGTDWEYDFAHDFGAVPVRSYGFGRAAVLYDEGDDVLGLGRRDLEFENSVRGFVDAKHRTVGPLGFSLTAEAGYVSDYNFLEQYEEPLWDNGKDVETTLEAKQTSDNWSLSLFARPALNDIFSQTQWLPRADFTILNQPLVPLGGINSSLNWSSHSSVGYGSIVLSETPPNLGGRLGDPFGEDAAVFSRLPYKEDVEGLVAMTRHELTLPFSVGAVNVVPYATGELSHWGEALDGEPLDRVYGAAGVRASLMMTKVLPYVRSDVWGLNGLAHKMVFDADYSVAESNVGLDEVAQYNEFDDNAQQRFRQRLSVLTYGGVLPPTADPRGYALRTGAGRSVTSPYHELVDDQNVLRLGWRHRLQTKVGPPANRRVKDWMTLDLEMSVFPGADDFTPEDNFGETLGLLSANYAWNVGERTSILADALYDVFDLGQETWSVGVLTQRPGRGSLYLGYRKLGLGDLDSDILAASYSYAMSPKWISSYGTSYDLAEGESRGHSLAVTRVGKDFLFRTGLDYDPSKDNFGVSFQIEPIIGRLDGDDLSSLLRTPTGRFARNRGL